MPLLMKVPGITGESKVHERVGWLGLAGFNWGGTRVVLRTTANRQGQPQRIWAPQLRSATARRIADAQTAQLWNIMVTNTELPS
jgi:type VI protein secretion system component Hcp